MAGTGAIWNWILAFFSGLIGAGWGFSDGADRSWIVMSRDCQLNYAMP